MDERNLTYRGNFWRSIYLAVRIIRILGGIKVDRKGSWEQHTCACIRNAKVKVVIEYLKLVSYVRYKTVWTPTTGQTCYCQSEEENPEALMQWLF